MCTGACTGCFGRAGRVVCLGCGFVEFWSFPDVEAPLGNHSTQSPASVQLASHGYTVGHYKGKYTFFSDQKVWWSLNWVLRSD